MCAVSVRIMLRVEEGKQDVCHFINSSGITVTPFTVVG